ncbi:MAG: DUF3052 family protein [Cellulomonadaceae bacterium]|jgi:hypothetical protein|nr:DUF3052 family protein [Cellulomonadaceae bacterium]
MVQSVAQKMQIKAGPVVIYGVPDDVDLQIPEDIEVITGLTAVDAKDAAAIISFVVMEDDLDTIAQASIAAATADRLAWIAYPKAGQLGTNLNRDSLARACELQGASPVRQVAINEVWSALRFRPATKDTRWTAAGQPKSSAT